MRRPNRLPLDFEISRFLPLIGLLLAALIFLPRCLLVVQPGYEAVIFNRLTGVEMSPRREGIHLLIPVLQFPTLYDVRTQTYNMTSQSEERSVKADDSLTALTADGQRVDLDVSVRYRLDPARVPEIHQNVGPNYLNKIIRPASQAVVRNVIARYSAIGVYSEQRAEIQEQIAAELTNLMQAEGLVLQSLLLRNVEFSKEFQSAIEAKQIAEQEKQREVFRVEQAELIKQRMIVKASGEAQAITLKGEALRNNPNVIQLEYVRNLPDDIKTIVSEQNVILNFGDFLSKSE
ncbi:prohibitin family protein [Thermostichus vulcanus]|uniref:Prohibitin family protein n=1 Tax=Thermostichus vulcanus str. 'Rupite' TaxID=2813851 RepID=A0ABT0CAD2_THEVL|nr:prohibitin family protein [Thermostichus vulcanus]MCJ2542711.1 prohibitin family protein [Thermostichus vulcanus str. 'Rupite']